MGISDEEDNRSDDVSDSSEERRRRRRKKKKKKKKRREESDEQFGDESGVLDEDVEKKKRRKKKKKKRDEESGSDNDDSDDDNGSNDDDDREHRRRRHRKKKKKRREGSDDDESSEEEVEYYIDKYGNRKKRRKRKENRDRDKSDRNNSDEESDPFGERLLASDLDDSEAEADGDCTMIVDYVETRSKFEIWMRRILLLPANPELETPTKRKLRYLAYGTLLCDMVAAIVSLVTFGEITYCCGKPILTMTKLNIDWAAVVYAVIVMYMVMIILEIYPVIRQGFPFNVVNPVIGFLITFAVFFDDAKTEAIIMWAVETLAVMCEMVIYRIKIHQCKTRAVEIKELMPKTTRKKSEVVEDEAKANTEMRMARQKFYILRKEQKKDLAMLKWLHVAVYMNIVLTSLVLVLILVISRSGGLCVKDFSVPNPFNGDQLSICYECGPEKEECEICTNTTEQCFFPYQ